MLFEHRYKLGATFALTKRYEKAYYWLHKSQKYGYDGETGFYYWLAKAAYFTGNKKVAQSAWKHLSIKDPDKGEVEPWNEEQQLNPRVSGEAASIMKMLRSNRLEERLCGIFLISVSNKKEELVTQSALISTDEFSQFEKEYLANIYESENKDQSDVEGLVKGHEVATILYERYKADKKEIRSLLSAWFSTFINGMKVGEKFPNAVGVAAATEYIWLRERNNKQTQKGIADQYGISQPTLRKYIQLLETYWK